ncbi:hypothetical protein D3C79_916440 [compost metagenome]
MYRLKNLLLQSQPCVHRIAALLRLRLATGKNAGHLTHRHTAFQPAEDAADLVDIGQGVQAMATVGASGLDEAVAALPGAQGYRVHARKAGDFTNREQFLVFQARIDFRGTSLFVHLH